jgi:hypothetical protein
MMRRIVLIGALVALGALGGWWIRAVPSVAAPRAAAFDSDHYDAASRGGGNARSAAKAGLQRGDVIVAVNGKPVVSGAQLRARVGLVPVGETVELEILRNGSRVKTSARIDKPAP